MEQIAPADLDKIRSHKFLVAFTGDGAFAEIVHGWDAMLDFIRHQFDDEGDWELPSEIMDMDSWRLDGWNLPFIFDSPEVGECCYFHVTRITRITQPLDTETDEDRDLNEFKLQYGRRGYMIARPEGGMTKFYDDEDSSLFEVQGQFDLQGCLQLQRAYRNGQQRGEIRGKSDLQFELRRLLDVAHPAAANG